MERKTDWDGYYRRPFKATTVTRRITTARLLRQLALRLPGESDVVEWGGANSCFIDAIYRALRPARYTVADSNRLGLGLLEARRENYPGLATLEDDVLQPRQPLQADIVFSVGLIEHFDAAGTARAIRAHFDSAREGGLVVISFPTPTWLYRATRWLAERLGLWIFHDERPLRFEEVEREMARHGDFVARDLIWPIFLTQGMLAFRKRSRPA